MVLHWWCGQLTDAVNATDRVFDLVHRNDDRNVGFAETNLSRTIQNNSTNITVYHFEIRIDFKDFDRVSGDRDAIEANSLGLVVLHEIDHNLYGSTRDSPNGFGDAGPVKTEYINPIREQLGLAQRMEYPATRVPRSFGG